MREKELMILLKTNEKKDDVLIDSLNKNVYNMYSNVRYHLRSDIFESEQILVSNSVFVKILGGFCSMSYSV